MRDLLNYPTTIYDANCIVYYVFHIPENKASGEPVIVIGPNTSRARAITERLVSNNKTISTIRAAWQEAEKVTIASALKRALVDGSVQSQLGTQGQATSMLEYRLAKGLKAQLAQLKKERWFSVDLHFVPKSEKVAAVKAAFAAFALDPEKQKKIPAYKGDPSDVDLALIVFSEETKMPLLTNDKELYNFSDELRDMHLCHRIKGFVHIGMN